MPEPVVHGRLSVLSIVARDLRHGFRLLLARPGFTAVAVTTLALGIGANTAIFSVVHSLLLAPLAVSRSRIASSCCGRPPSTIASDNSHLGARTGRTGATARRRSRAVGIWENLTYNISGGEEPEQVAGMRVSAGAFPMLGVAPQLGRTFTDAEDEPGHHVVVISDALWRRRFAADPGAIGQTLRVNGEPYEVVGVMPPRFSFLHHRFHVWVPIAFNATDADGTRTRSSPAAGSSAGLPFDAARNGDRRAGPPRRRPDPRRPRRDADADGRLRRRASCARRCRRSSARSGSSC